MESKSNNSFEEKQGKWQINRRSFVKAGALGAFYLQLSFITSCKDDANTSPLSNSSFTLLKNVQTILFPSDESGPGASELNADKYVLWILNDKRLDQDEVGFLKNGLVWTDETALEMKGKAFIDLNIELQKEVIKSIASESWGESWLSLMLTYIFEAMVSDPIYGFNDLELGWSWLGHQAGYPRPDENTKYDTIFTTINRKDEVKEI